MIPSDDGSSPIGMSPSSFRSSGGLTLKKDGYFRSSSFSHSEPLIRKQTVSSLTEYPKLTTTSNNKLSSQFTSIITKDFYSDQEMLELDVSEPGEDKVFDQKSLMVDSQKQISPNKKGMSLHSEPLILANNDESKEKKPSQLDPENEKEANDEQDMDQELKDKRLTLMKRWEQKLKYKNTLPERLPYCCITKLSWWQFMRKFSAGKIEADDDNRIRTHGSMGCTYMHSVPLQMELEVLRCFYEGVYLSDMEICLAPSLTRPYFVWFTDIDMKQTFPLGADYIRILCGIVARTVSRFYPRLMNMPSVPVTESKFGKSNDTIIEVRGTSQEDSMKIRTFWNPELGLWMGAGDGQGRLRFSVSSSGLKFGKNKNGVDEYGVGIHINSIGRLLVTEDQARQMLSAIRSECEIELGQRDPLEGFNSWQDVFDASVYKGQGGTRSLGSCKVKACPKCEERLPVLSIVDEQKEIRQYETKTFSPTPDGPEIRTAKKILQSSLKGSLNCSICKGRKKYLEKKSYEVKFVLNHLGEEDQEFTEWLCNDPFQALLATNTRTSIIDFTRGSTSYWEAIPGYALAQVPGDNYSSQQQQSGSSNKKYIRKKSESQKKKDWEKKAAPVDGLQEAKVYQKYPANAFETQRVLHYAKEMDMMYVGLLSEMLQRKSKDRYVLDVNEDSQNSHYCLRCSKEHVNRIYFEVKSDNYVYQKSYSNNKDCENGPVRRIKISSDMADILFGQSIAITENKAIPIDFNAKYPHQDKRNMTLKPDPNGSGKYFLDENNTPKVKKQMEIAIYSWIMQRRKDRDPGTQRLERIARESQRMNHERNGEYRSEQAKRKRSKYPSSNSQDGGNKGSVLDDSNYLESESTEPAYAPVWSADAYKKGRKKRAKNSENGDNGRGGPHLPITDENGITWGSTVNI